MITSIYIENEQLDLFEDENIIVNSSVLDIQDITKNTTEYSNSYTVPASENNNIIFKHYYNADIDNAFDARVKVTARIEISGKVFREGKVSLQKVNVKNGSASSYMLNFFGRLVSLKETFGSDKLSNLDFSAFDQDYEPDFIKALLTNNQTPYEILNAITHRTELICSLLSNRKYFYASNAGAYDETIEANIWYDAGGSPNPNNGVFWKDLKPSFLIREIIAQIETDYSLNFTGGFFDSAMFDNIYIILDNGSDEKKIAGEETTITVDTSTGTPVSKAYIGTSTTAFTVNSPEVFSYTLTITADTGYEDVNFTVRIYDNGVLVAQQSASTFVDIELIYSYLTASGNHSIVATIEPEDYIEYYSEIEVVKSVGGTPIYTENATVSTPNVVTPLYKVSSQMPDMTILDFLKGLIQLYKLVVISTSDTDIYIDNVNTYYNAGNTIDLTKYVNTNQLEVSRPDLLNKIMFQFQPPTTILNKNFKGVTEEAYGDEKLYIYDDAGDLIDGSTSDINPPFEQIIYERLIDEQDSISTAIQYGALIDDKLAAINIKPHIHYAVLRAIDAKTIGFNNGSVIVELSANYWAPSHIADDAAFGTALIFGSEIDEYSKRPITTTLYSEYYASYISDLFNIKRRNYSLKATDIPMNIISDIRLNDIIKVGINFYRIDNMNINITTGQIKFNLFNI